MKLMMGTYSMVGRFLSMNEELSRNRLLNLRFPINLKSNWGSIRFRNGSNEYYHFAIDILIYMVFTVGRMESEVNIVHLSFRAIRAIWSLHVCCASLSRAPTFYNVFTNYCC